MKISRNKRIFLAITSCLAVTGSVIAIINTYSRTIDTNALNSEFGVVGDYITRNPLPEQEELDSKLAKSQYPSKSSPVFTEETFEPYFSLREQNCGINDGNGCSGRVKNQSQEGLCWAYSFTTSLESNIRMKYGINTEISAKQLDYMIVDASEAFSDSSTNEYNDLEVMNLAIGARHIGDGGYFLMPAFMSATDKTMASESTFFNRMSSSDSRLSSYTGYENVATDLYSGILNTYLVYDHKQSKNDVFADNKSSYIVTEYSEHENVINYGESTSADGISRSSYVDMIKSAIKHKGAVNGSIQMDGSAACYDAVHDTLIDKGRPTCNGGHAVAIIGWDDNHEYTDGGVTKYGAFIIQNSWGTSSSYAIFYLAYDSELSFNFIDSIEQNTWDEIYDITEASLVDNNATGDSSFRYNFTSSHESTVSDIAIMSLWNTSDTFDIYISPNGLDSSFQLVGSISLDDSAQQRILHLSTPITINSGAFSVKLLSRYHSAHYPVGIGAVNDIYPTIYTNYTSSSANKIVNFTADGADVGTVSKSFVKVPSAATFVANGDVLTFSNGETVTADLSASKSGHDYNFVSWSMEGSKLSDGTSYTPSNGAVIKANFKDGPVVGDHNVSIFASNATVEGNSIYDTSVEDGTTYTISGASITFTDSTSSFTLTAVPSNSFGYITSFDGWYLGSSPLTDGSTGTITADTDFDVKFNKVIDKQISVDVNDNSLGSVDKGNFGVDNGSSYVVVGNTIEFYASTSSSSLSEATPTRAGGSSAAIVITATPASGISFDYWSINGTSVSSGDSGTITADTSIVANFTTAAVTNTYTLYLDLNDGSSTIFAQSTCTTTTGTSCNADVTPTSPTRTGYDFLGWSETSSGTVAYRPGASVSIHSDKTLYAVWQLQQFTVSFAVDSSLGVVSHADVIVPYGATFSASGSTLTFRNGPTTIEVITASPKTVPGYSITFDSWSPDSGTITADTTITANFTSTASPSPLPPSGAIVWNPIDGAGEEGLTMFVVDSSELIDLSTGTVVETYDDGYIVRGLVEQTVYNGAIYYRTKTARDGSKDYGILASSLTAGVKVPNTGHGSTSKSGSSFGNIVLIVGAILLLSVSVRFYKRKRFIKRIRM